MAADLTALAAGDVVTAVAAGRLADGSPVTRRVRFVLARPVTELGFSRPDTARIFYRVWVPALRRFDHHPAVVLTDSIERAS